MATPDRTSLIQSPTPVHRLNRVSEDIGLDLWIKRDDLTGFALGGNKGRKLEYIMAEALRERAQVMVTCGALQSNFVRQLGAACAMYGIRCVAAVMNLPYDREERKPTDRGLDAHGGNVTLDRLFGVELHLVPDDDWTILYGVAESLGVQYEKEGLRVYRVPVGGSSALGGYAFFQAAKELERQTGPFDFIVTASSSGSTQAGLGQAYHGSATRLIGIAADTEPDLIEDVLRVSSGLGELLGLEHGLGAKDFDIRPGWAGPAYGVPSGDGNAAIEYLACKEGILLDPIYTGKAFAGLLALARAGELKGRVLFWHTGGVPALFAMGSGVRELGVREPGT